MNVLEWILSILTGCFVFTVGFLLIETIASYFPIRRANQSSPNRPSCVILIPAHNEELGLGDTLTSLRTELHEGDRILVVADNCIDGTAKIAREFGAEVLERTDDRKRGKGFALEAGLNFLKSNCPEIVVILDADCRFEAGSLNSLLIAARVRERPMQAIYLPGVRDDGSLKSKIARFALRFKNEVRPRGLHRLGLPCLLTGSGMALPWASINSVDWGTGSIVEDMRLGIDLAIAGYPPELCPESKVLSDAPPTDAASIKQRTRWEHGHVATILSQAPRLLIRSCFRLRPRLFFLALELSVPPLSLFVLGLIGLTALNGLFWLFAEGTGFPLIGSLFCWMTLSLTIILAWGKYGRGIVPLSSLILLPLYLLWKLPIYLRLVSRRETKWVRTDRANLH